MLHVNCSSDSFFFKRHRRTTCSQVSRKGNLKKKKFSLFFWKNLRGTWGSPKIFVQTFMVTWGYVKSLCKNLPTLICSFISAKTLLNYLTMLGYFFPFISAKNRFVSLQIFIYSCVILRLHSSTAPLENWKFSQNTSPTGLNWAVLLSNGKARSRW